MLDFDRAGFLFLIPLALALLWLGSRSSLANWGKIQTLVCSITRGLIVLLICLALAGPRWALPTTEPAVIFLRDASASIGTGSQGTIERYIEEATRDGNTRRSAEVIFAAEPRVSRTFGAEKSATEKIPPEFSTDATDLSGALEFAAALLPSDKPGRIVLLSDGQFTAGHDPLAAMADLAQKGVEVDVVPLHEPTGAEAAVVSLRVPPGVREGEVFDLPVEVHAGVETAATLKLYQNNLLASEITANLPAGSSRVVFPNIRADGRLAVYEVRLTADKDTRNENNRRHAATAHAGAAKILVIDREPAQAEPFAEALRSAGFELEVRPPAGFPERVEELEGFDMVVFSNAPAADFRDEQFVMLQGWVRDFGGAFLMLGGEGSFGAGAYFRTPIAALLPVRIEREEREETPVVALLVILDRSGSMSAPAGGQTKMDLANRGAALALDILQGKDLFGLFAVDTRVQDVLPLGRITDRAGSAGRIAGITSGGGGIYIYTSLAEAYPRLRDAKAKIKHIILFSDAADAEEKIGGEKDGQTGGSSALDLASAMLANRITLSVVALGSEQDRDTAFLRQLAAQGGGRFYLTADATTLPRLFTIETMRAAESSVREDAFLAQPTGADSPILAGLDWKNAPLLLGFNVTKLKPGAEQLLATEQGDPLFVTWRYGLGQVGVFTSDAKARWAADWLAWPGFGKFWTQAARQLARSSERKDFSAHLREENGRLILDAEAQSPDGDFRNGLSVDVTVADPQGGKATTISAPQVAPGHYRASLPIPKGESAFFAVSDGVGRPVSLAWAKDYPAEFRPAQDSRPLLQKIATLTSGKFDPKPAEIFRPALQPTLARREMAPWLLALALLLWPLDVWLRRRDWGSGNTLPHFSSGR